MRYLIALAALTVSAALVIKKVVHKNLTKKKVELERLEGELEKLTNEHANLKAANRELEKTVAETMTLYDITSNLSHTLDEEKILAIFKESLNRYMGVEECKFLKAGEDLMPYTHYTVLPLVLHKSTIGYVVASGIEDKDRDVFRILAAQFFSGIKRAHLYTKFQELSITDTLTQVCNRRYFMERFEEEMARSKKFKLFLSFLMVDVDYFKECNDRYGHLVGDAVLRDVTRAIKEMTRQIDFMGRYGGEEIAIAFVETDKAQARQAAERIRQAIEQKSVRAYDEELKVTISVGVATFPDDAHDALGLIEKADRALYLAKEKGRNRVCVHESLK